MSRDSNVLNLSLNPIHEHSASPVHRSPGSSHWEHDQYTNLPSPAGRRNGRKLERQSHVSSMDAVMGDSIYAILKSDKHLCEEERKITSQDTNLSQRRGQNTPTRLDTSGMPLQQSELDLIFGPSPTSPASNRISPNGGPGRRGVFSANYRNNSFAKSQIKSPIDGNVSGLLNSSFNTASDVLSSRRNTFDGGASNQKQSHSFDDLQSLNRTRRRTIAPLDSLDSSIQKRKNRSHSKLPELLDKEIIEEDEIETPGRSSESEVSIPSQKSNLEKVQSLPESSSRRLQSTDSSLGENDKTREMKTAFKKVKERFIHNQQQQHATSTNNDHRRRRINSVKNDLNGRKPSEGFKSRILRRAKSVITRQPKKSLDDSKELPSPIMPKHRSMFYEKGDSFEEVATSNTASPLSNRPNSMQFPYPFADNTESKLNSSTVSEVLMQGDLYRKKLGHWVNSWAVLTADKVFTLYKTKEFYEELKYFTRESSCDNIPTMIDSPESKSGIILSINLKDGCEVENINQGKTKVTFSLVPHTYRSLPPHLDNNLSYEAGLWWDKPVQLMSKNNSEFLYWIKAFVQLNKREGSTPQQSQFQGNGHAVLLRRELSNQSNNSENDHPTSKVLNPNRTVDSNLSYKNPMKMNQVALKAKKDDLPFIDDSLMPMRTHKKVHRHKLKVKTKTSFEEKRSDSENDFKSLELSTSPGIKSAEIIFASHGYPCCESSKNSLSSEDGGLILVTPNHATCTCKNHSNGSLKHEVGEKSKPNKDIERNNKLAVNGENMTEHKETSREKQDAEFVNNKETNKGCGNVTTQGVSPISSTNKPPDTFSLGEKPPIHKTNSDNVDATKTNNSVADRKTLIANKQIVAPKISIDLDYSSPVYSSASSGSEDEDDVLNRRGPRSFLSVKEGRTGGTNVKKQQSLRQRVLRKLKAKNSLSSSTPNLNVQKGNSEPRVDLKVVEPETSASTPASPVVVRRQKKSHIKVPKIEKIEVHRSRSEGDIFKAVTNAKHPSTKRADMRTFRNSRQLSRDNFIETFGVISKKSMGIEYQRNTRQSMFEVDRFVHYSQNDVSDIINGSDRYSSQIETSSESAGSMSSSNDGVSTHSYGRTVVSESQSPISKTFKAAMTPSRKTKSTGSDASNERDPIKENHRTSWLSSLTPHFPKRSTSKASTSTPGAVGRRAVYQIPATQLAASSHRGYLDRRNKKKQWERFWCVLQDSCLYFYNAPQSELTQDAIVLRGYDVIADVTNMNRSRFSFRLERNGSPTLHFSSDNHENFLLWVGTLVKETSIVSSNISNNEILARSAQSVQNIVQEQTETPKLANIVEDSKKQDFTYKPVSDEEIKKQKEALLREVLLVQQKIIDEQNATLDDATNKPPHPRSSKVFVHEKYDREKQVGEVKNLKMMTHLNRRRNSAQLKLDQISKQLAPKTGRKRREDPRQYADMEKRLKYLQDRLRQVDLEIQEEQEKKKQDLEKLQQKMDLELLVLEQKENLEIIKRHHQRRQMEARDKENHNSSSLTAIEEANVVSDTSSNSEDAVSVDRTSSGHGKFTTTPITSFQSNSVGGDSASSTSYDSLHHKNSDENFSYVNRLNSASSNDDVFGTDTNASISQDICNNNNIVKYPKAEEINPSVLAEIDDFIEFSKEKRKALS